jgi:hypothetical protein
MSNITAQKWEKRLSIRRNAQFEQRAHFRSRNKQIGIPTIIVSSIVGSAVFGTIGTTDMVPLQFAAGALSIIAAALSAVQTFLSYDSLAEQSKFAAAGYSSLLRKLERYIETNPDKMDSDFMKEFSDEWDKIDSEAPPLPKSARMLLEQDTEV